MFLYAKRLVAVNTRNGNILDKAITNLNLGIINDEIELILTEISYNQLSSKAKFNNSNHVYILLLYYVRNITSSSMSLIFCITVAIVPR